MPKVTEIVGDLNLFDSRPLSLTSMITGFLDLRTSKLQ